jgi:xanthine dehydrogenase iron-sulfur cluster and FAD-binding subunit A
MWDKYHSVATIQEALDLLDREKGKTKIIAGGTDLILEMKQGLHQGVSSLVDISRVEDLARIWVDDEEMVHIGASVTHNQCIASKIIKDHAFPLLQACYGVGTPQIRNVATIAGNLATASPANDTIVPLISLDADLILASKSGQRIVQIKDFYKGVRSTVLLPNEMITEIKFRKMKENQRGVFKRYILRATHSISVVNMSILLTLDGGVITNVVIAVGCVAPTIVRAQEAEFYLIGKVLGSEIIEKASALTLEAIKPISDIRASDKYRTRLVKLLVADGLNEILSHKEKSGIPEQPVFLWGKSKGSKRNLTKSALHTGSTKIQANINHKEINFDKFQDGLLIDLIREGAGLTGTKLGCGEGECGACTVTMDGLSVLSCLIPAPRAHGTVISTIEGVAREGDLHPVQKAYIEEGAIQCGYCTPGFIMSSIQLLDEIPHPTKNQIKEGLSGNLCRCTGYYRIIAAVEQAAKMMSQ